MLATGIVLAIIAMLSWGFGDFLIQKSARKLGDMETLLFVSAIGMVILFPFSYTKIIPFFSNLANGGYIYLLASVFLLIASIINFDALKKGKLAVVEPIWSFEIPTATLLAYFLLHESLSGYEIGLIVLLMVFLVLVSFRDRTLSSRILLEKGVILAFVGAMLMGSAQFFMGWGARVIDPVFINFITDVFLTVFCLLYLAYKGRIHKSLGDVKANVVMILPMALSDKIAWLAYAFAMTLAPIGIATALSESYIIITVILGMSVNKEKLYPHQKVGLIGAVVVAVVLAAVGSR